MEKIRNLIEKINGLFKYNILKRENWPIEEDSQVMWNGMSNIIRRVTKRFLRIKRVSVAYQEMLLVEPGGLKEIIKEKRTHFETRRILTKKEAKKALIEAYLMHLSSSTNLSMKVEQKKTYKLVQTREKKSNNLGNIRCIKCEDNRFLARVYEIGKKKLYDEKLVRGV